MDLVEAAKEDCLRHGWSNLRDVMAPQPNAGPPQPSAAANPDATCDIASGAAAHPFDTAG